MTTTDKTVKVRFNSRIIDQLGTDMYQSPVSAIAELISNAWDADAENVTITYPTENITSPDAEIVIKDNGVGMSFEELQDKYLNIGYNRRGANMQSFTKKGRRIMGRKGLGKFSGFGIANLIEIESVSQISGERFIFKMDLNEFKACDTGNGFDFTTKSWPLEIYEQPDLTKIEEHGTIIRLRNLTLSQNIRSDFAQSIARRFVLHSQNDNFNIIINDAPVPSDDTFNLLKYDYPRDYTSEERENLGITVDEEGYAIESIGDHEIKWRIAFTNTPASKEVNGISIFAANKIAQNPFFFNLTGNISAQHALAYLVGQVKADFVDSFPQDMIGPERQRINWTKQELKPFMQWGQNKIRELTNLWKKRRTQAKQEVIVSKVTRFGERMQKLQPSEQKSLKKAINKIAEIEELNEDKFEVLADGLLLAAENGRLQQLIVDIGEQEDNFDAGKFLELLAEEKVLSAVQIGETIYNKIQVLKMLYSKVNNRERENPIRDFIADHPWIISPAYDTFLKEKNMKTLIVNYFEQNLKEQDIEETKEHFRKRVDLILINNNSNELVILEFMKPGEKLDLDHISRTEFYMNIVEEYCNKTNSSDFRQYSLKAAYIIADGLASTIARMANKKAENKPPLYILDWATLLNNSLRNFEEYLDLIIDQAPDDFRIRTMKESLSQDSSESSSTETANN